VAQESLERTVSDRILLRPDDWYTNAQRRWQTPITTFNFKGIQPERFLSPKIVSTYGPAVIRPVAGIKTGVEEYLVGVLSKTSLNSRLDKHEAELADFLRRVKIQLSDIAPNTGAAAEAHGLPQVVGPRSLSFALPTGEDAATAAGWDRYVAARRRYTNAVTLVRTSIAKAGVRAQLEEGAGGPEQQRLREAHQDLTTLRDRLIQTIDPSAP
jgi:hypothetical protein